MIDLYSCILFFFTGSEDLKIFLLLQTVNCCSLPERFLLGRIRVPTFFVLLRDKDGLHKIESQGNLVKVEGVKTLSKRGAVTAPTSTSCSFKSAYCKVLLFTQVYCPPALSAATSITKI